MEGKKDEETVTLADRLAQLPPSEHAILLNRFKFLSLVQRVAAADVAEMINTVGLEALTYKTALEHLPAPLPKPKPKPKPRGQTARSRAAKPPEAAEGLSRTNRPKPRFRDRAAEEQFIERMAQPARRGEAAAFDLMARRPTREPVAVPAPGPPAEKEWPVEREENTGEDSDAVMMDYSSDDQLRGAVVPPAPGREGSAGSMGHLQHKQEEQQHQQLRQHPQERPPPILRRGDQSMDAQLSVKVSRVAFSRGGVPRVAPLQTQSEADERYRDVSPVSPAMETSQNISQMEVMTPNALSSYASRTRGHFAPKAKPKAAADTPRVPLEVIRHASALIARKATFGASSRQGMPDLASSNSVPLRGQTGGSLESNPSNPITSQSQAQETGGTLRSVPWSKDDDVPYTTHASRGDGNEKGGVIHDEDLAELTSCIERMLQDHRAVLDSIVKEEPVNASERTPLPRHVTPAPPTRHETPTDTNKASRLLNIASEVLEDLSDEEDELLLINRLQRSVGAMDRELEAIARGEQRPDEDKYSDEDLNEDEKKAVADALTAARRRKAGGQRVAFVNPKDKTAARDKAKRRRRGEMPTSIVERLRSFRKENHDYIRYTEKLWNNSHVTEQVFAHRLTESLLDDLFGEVFGEVSTILDEYVEGLAQHELR